MRLTPLEWGLRAPITPRLGGNCWGPTAPWQNRSGLKKNKPAPKHKTSDTSAIPTSKTWTQITIPNIRCEGASARVGFWANSDDNNWIAVDDVEFFRARIARASPFAATESTEQY